MYDSAYGLSAGGAKATAYIGPACTTVCTPDDPPLVCGLKIFCLRIIIILNLLMFLNLLCSYGLDGLWSGATSISDGIFCQDGVRQSKFLQKKVQSNNNIKQQLFRNKMIISKELCIH